MSFSCTPTCLRELGVGFLFNEGLIHSVSEVLEARLCAGETHIDIWLNHSPQKPRTWTRTSGCSGGVTAAEAAAPLTPARCMRQVTPAQVCDSMRQLLEKQEQYREVRGMHCSGLSDGQRVVVAAEDIGRHNTLDKLAGMRLLIPLEEELPLLLTTGRVSAEMMQKAAHMGVQLVISRTAPTVLSVALAWQVGITLIGYARQTQFNIYTHPQRVAGAPEDFQALSKPAER